LTPQLLDLAKVVGGLKGDVTVISTQQQELKAHLDRLATQPALPGEIKVTVEKKK
jgi:hypothetical protein